MNGLELLFRDKAVKPPAGWAELEPREEDGVRARAACKSDWEPSTKVRVSMDGSEAEERTNQGHES
jgi:hypothetical protein